MAETMGTVWLMIAGLFVASFLLGSIPWGVIISRLFFHKDLRNEGSGNIGTTNAMRSLGKVGGAAVFVLDFAKGIFAGLLGLGCASLMGVPDSAANAVIGLGIVSVEPGVELKAAAAAAAPGFLRELALCVAFLGCVWGHIFSPWLKFKGGKGIAVAIGCLFVTFGLVGACIELLVFIILVPTTRYVSVGSIAAAAACPFLALWFFWGNWIAVALCTIAAITVIWAHRGNIERLRTGTERRIGAKKKEKCA